MDAKFTLFNAGGSLIFTNHENRLLFFHTGFTSSQLMLDHIGVELLLSNQCCKLSMQSTNTEQTVQFFFIKEDYLSLKAFFRKMGFPVPDRPPVNGDLVTHLQ